MAFSSDRAFMAQRRADEGSQISIYRSLYSVYRRYEWLGADGSDGPGFLTIATVKVVFRPDAEDMFTEESCQI